MHQVLIFRVELASELKETSGRCFRKGPTSVVKRCIPFTHAQTMAWVLIKQANYYNKSPRGLTRAWSSLLRLPLLLLLLLLVLLLLLLLLLLLFAIALRITTIRLLLLLLPFP